MPRPRINARARAHITRIAARNSEIFGRAERAHFPRSFVSGSRIKDTPIYRASGDVLRFAPHPSRIELGENNGRRAILHRVATKRRNEADDVKTFAFA